MTRTRNFVCSVMIVLFPLSLTAQDAGAGGAAILHTKGGVWVNGAEAVDSSSIFPGDFLEIRPGFAANLDAEGSSVLIQPESTLKFEGNSIFLEHGGLSVGTSTSMSVRVNCLKIEPVNSERTQYDVADSGGTIQVSALKNDVKITQTGSVQKASKKTLSFQSAIVREGGQDKRSELEACGAASQPATAGSGLNTKWLEIGGGVAAGGLILCLIFCRSPGPSEMSQSDP